MVALDKLDLSRMRPGLSSRVVVHAVSQRDALLVPRAALDFASAKPARASRQCKIADIILGACNAQECIVKSGLNEGETLGHA